MALQVCNRANRPTDHATRSLTIDRIYVRSTAMRPNNNTFLYRHKVVTSEAVAELRQH